MEIGADPERGHHTDFEDNMLILIARIALSLLFLWVGFRKILNWNTSEDYMKGKHTKWSSYLLPIIASLQIVGGLSVVLGFYARVGALLLIIVTLPATIQMHDFWNLKGKERIEESTHFLKDIAIIGGLLLLILIGAGQYSITR